MPTPSPAVAAVSAVSAAFVAEFGDALADPRLAHDRCVPVSEEFARRLAAEGVEAEVLTGAQCTEFQGMRVMVCGHFAVRVGNQVFDWTARQFDPAAPVPLVESVESWRERWPVLG